MLNYKKNEKYNIIEIVVNCRVARKEAMCELKKLDDKSCIRSLHISQFEED